MNIYMELEPCPICGSPSIIHSEESGTGYSSQIEIVYYVLCGKDFTNNPCSYRGPWNDPDGSLHNRLSLDSRFGKICREYPDFELYEEHDPYTGDSMGTFIWMESWNKPYHSGFSSRDDAIRNAWNTLYPKGD